MATGSRETLLSNPGYRKLSTGCKEGGDLRAVCHRKLRPEGLLLQLLYLTCLVFGLATPALAVTNPPTITGGYNIFTTATKSVTITADVGASINYTTDGSTPTTGSPAYTGAFTISATTTIKAIATISGVSSTVTTAVMTKDTTASGVPQNNLVVWLRGDTGVLTSGSNVTDWINLKNNALSASQSTGANQPTLVSSAINTCPSVSFDGSTSYMTFPTGFSSFSGTGPQIFIVTKPTAINNNARFFDFSNFTSGVSSNNVYVSETTTNGATFGVVTGTTPSSVTATNGITTNVYQMLEFSDDTAGTATAWTNAVQTGIGDIGTINTTTRNDNFLGSNHGQTVFFQGEIAELIIASGVSAGNKANIENYLANRYGIPLISPTRGVFTGSAQITMTTPGSGATQRYTLDGSTPISSSTAYSSPFTLTSSATINSKTFYSGGGSSTMASAYVQIVPFPLNVPSSGLLTWLKSDFGLQTSGSSVTKWLDMSAVVNDARQSSSSNQPTMVTNALNGYPAVSFDGSNDFLQFDPGFFLSTLSVFAVLSPANTSTGIILDVANGATSNNVYLSTAGTVPTLTSTIDATHTASVSGSSGSIGLNQFQLLEAFQNTSPFTGSIFVNGQQVVSNTLNSVSGAKTRTLNCIGSNYNGSASFFQGKMCELLVYNRKVTTTERIGLEIYFINKYNLLNTVPPAPTISVSTGTLSEPTQVAISSPDGSPVFFTVDGTTPTPSSNAYSAPISVLYSQTIKAITVRDGASSSVASASYTLDTTRWPAPNGSDPTPLQIHLVLPTVGIP